MYVRSGISLFLYLCSYFVIYVFRRVVRYCVFLYFVMLCFLYFSHLLCRSLFMLSLCLLFVL